MDSTDIGRGREVRQLLIIARRGGSPGSQVGLHWHLRRGFLITDGQKWDFQLSTIPVLVPSWLGGLECLITFSYVVFTDTAGDGSSLTPSGDESLNSLLHLLCHHARREVRTHRYSLVRVEVWAFTGVNQSEATVFSTVLGYSSKLFFKSFCLAK